MWVRATNLVHSQPFISHAGQPRLAFGSQLNLIACHSVATISFWGIPSDAHACAVAAKDCGRRRGVRGYSSCFSYDSVAPIALALLDKQAWMTVESLELTA